MDSLQIIIICYPAPQVKHKCGKKANSGGQDAVRAPRPVKPPIPFAGGTACRSRNRRKKHAHIRRGRLIPPVGALHEAPAGRSRIFLRLIPWVSAISAYVSFAPRFHAFSGFLFHLKKKSWERKEGRGLKSRPLHPPKIIPQRLCRLSLKGFFSIAIRSRSVVCAVEGLSVRWFHRRGLSPEFSNGPSRARQARCRVARFPRVALAPTTGSDVSPFSMTRKNLQVSLVGEQLAAPVNAG